MSRLDELYPSQCHKFERFRAEYERIKHLVGDFAEFGVANGGGSRELSRLDPTRLVFAFDTFSGMPAEDYHPGEDDANPPGKWAPQGTPEQLFEGIANIVPVVGRFAVTLSKVIIPRLLLVHIDCDYYESYRQVLEFLESRMVQGGVAFIDDYDPEHNCLGCRRAVDEWVATMRDRVRHDQDKIYF